MTTLPTQEILQRLNADGHVVIENLIPKSMAADAEPLPNFTLSIQTASMLDDFSVDNGAAHVATGFNHTQRKPPRGQEALANETVLAGPANVTDPARSGVIVQYGRSWVKPFVDLRAPIDAEQAAAFSLRLRYMLGCNANAPVRG